MAEWVPWMWKKSNMKCLCVRWRQYKRNELNSNCDISSIFFCFDRDPLFGRESVYEDMAKAKRRHIPFPISRRCVCLHRTTWHVYHSPRPKRHHLIWWRIVSNPMEWVDDMRYGNGNGNHQNCIKCMYSRFVCLFTDRQRAPGDILRNFIVNNSYSYIKTDEYIFKYRNVPASNDHNLNRNENGGTYISRHTLTYVFRGAGMVQEWMRDDEKWIHIASSGVCTVCMCLCRRIKYDYGRECVCNFIF